MTKPFPDIDVKIVTEPTNAIANVHGQYYIKCEAVNKAGNHVCALPLGHYGEHICMEVSIGRNRYSRNNDQVCVCKTSWQ